MALFNGRVAATLGFFFLGVGALAAEPAAPVCPAYGRSLPIINEQVAHWKRTTRNQFRERGHVNGSVTRVFPSATGHVHFEIAIGKRSDEVIEVIYNTVFGQIPRPARGMTIEACGDYITSTGKSGHFPPSPSGAIIHWVHRNPAGKGHEPGFLVINGVLYGQDTSHAGRSESHETSFAPPYYGR